MFRFQKPVMLIVLLAAAGILAAKLPKLSQEDVIPTDAGVIQAEESAATADQTRHEREARSEMMREIHEVLATQRARVKELRTQMYAASDEDAAMQIQGEIQRIKIETEFDIMGIQAEHARRAGRVDVAERIEQALQRMREPAAPKPSMPRSRPEAGVED